jgi:hypothetical protein
MISHVALFGGQLINQPLFVFRILKGRNGISSAILPVHKSGRFQNYCGALQEDVNPCSGYGNG